MKPHTYETPAAFRAALDARLRQAAAPGTGFERRRQLLIFDRYLARLGRVIGDGIMLKGGLALELRLERARTTRDIDLRLTGSPAALLERLQEAGRLDLGDHMTFEVWPDEDQPDITGVGVRYGGQRFRAECRIAGKRYGNPFGVDVGIGDPILGDPEEITGEDLLAFAGVPPPRLRVYPVESHIAEKLHAYTLPRERPNSRVKDLPDLALLGQAGVREAARIRRALEQTFGHRGTHAVPSRLPDPPESWAEPYEAIAEEDMLPWRDLPAVAAAAKSFLDPVLASDAAATWHPDTWSWRPAP